MADSGCRILLLSCSRKSAMHFVDKMSPNTSLYVPDTTAAQSIPWTISNKYYEAAVHFQFICLPPMANDVSLPSDTPQVPAVIFVWTHGQNYKEHVTRISQQLRDTSSHPDVCLAIRVPSSEPSEENDADIDEFLSSLGFEFIEARQDPDQDTDTIPGTSRALDALSTIMWPSMIPHGRSSKPRMTNDWHQDVSFSTTATDGEDEEDGDDDEDDDPQRHLDELARWLDEDMPSHTPLRDDPWANAASSALSSSPPRIGQEEKLGFEDDFTVFVSAPPISDEVDDDSAIASPTGGGGGGLGVSPLYHSLGSMSDLGELNEHDDNDQDLPSRAEIMSASTRIFDGANAEDGAFDLTSVLSALEGMKEEIASIADEDERRRAAARVALGLVYGLDNQKTDNTPLKSESET